MTTIKFQCRITNRIPDGFIADNYTVKSLFANETRVVQKVFPEIFKEGDNLEFNIEPVKSIGKDVVHEGFVETYAVVNEARDRGFYLKEYDEDKNMFMRVLKYEEKGFIFSDHLADHPYEVGDILRIRVKRL